MPQKTKHGPHYGQFSSSGAVESLQAGLPSNTKVKTAPHGAHTLGSCQNHTHLGPQIPSGQIPG